MRYVNLLTGYSTTSVPRYGMKIKDWLELTQEQREGARKMAALEYKRVCMNATKCARVEFRGRVADRKPSTLEILVKQSKEEILLIVIAVIGLLVLAARDGSLTLFFMKVLNLASKVQLLDGIYRMMGF